MYTCTYVHFVITSTWHLTHGSVNVSYRYSVIISRVWDVTILLCFCGAIGGLTLFTMGNPCIMELPRCLNICMDMGVPSSGCTVRFNPWYINFISGLHSCENQPPYSWLIVKLLPLLWVKKYKWSCWNPFLWPTVFRWAVMFYSMAKSSALVILCESYSWMNILGGHKWHNILKLNYCAACANIVHTSKLK